MIRNSLFVSVTLLCVALLGFMSRLGFLAPYKKALWLRCGGSVMLYLCTLGLNLFAATLAINRKFLLKDTGRKLSHFDTHLQAGGRQDVSRFFEELH
jgi:hypothetical protein